MLHSLIKAIYIFPSQETNVVSSNSAYGDVSSIQHYVIKLVSDVRFSPPIKLTTTI